MVAPDPCARGGWLAPLRRAARAFFQQDLALQRDGRSLRVVLQDRDPAAATTRPRAPTTEEQRQAREQRWLELAREQLGALLDEEPGARERLRPLAFVALALERHGWDALQVVPADLLRRALEQFEARVSNWSPQGLAVLRSKMAVALLAREGGPGGAAGARAGRGDADADLDADGHAHAAPAALPEARELSPQLLAARAVTAAAASSAGATLAPRPAEDAAGTDDAAALLAAYAALGVEPPHPGGGAAGG